jgi:hypothetical protein
VSLSADAVRALVNSKHGAPFSVLGPGVRSEPVPWHGQPRSVTLDLPSLGALLFRRTGP